MLVRRWRAAFPRRGSTDPRGRRGGSQPHPEAVRQICRGVERIVERIVEVTDAEVTDAEVGLAMACYFTDTHNLSEGAGAVPLAAALKERTTNLGKRIGLILTGANVDRPVFARVLRDAVPPLPAGKPKS